MIGFIGLSHLSLCYAASLLKKNKKIIIFDIKSEIENFKKGKIKVFEKGLDIILKKKIHFLTITSEKKKLKNCKIFFLAKDITTDNKNNIQLNYTKKLLSLLDKELKNKDLVIMNQVPVGFTRNLKRNLDKTYHFVETLVFGNAINRASRPERIIIGKNKSNSKVSKEFSKILNIYKCPIIDLTFEESELTKGFINTFLASQLMTTNFLNEVAEKYNANWNKIIKAIKLDKRIGMDGYYVPGLGISGGNIERDIQTLKRITKTKKLKNKFPQFIIKSNNYYKSWIERIIKNKKLQNQKIGLLGFTYKENTLSSKNSCQVELIKKFKSNILIHDLKKNDLINRDENKSFSNLFVSIKEILSKCETIIIFHNIKIYKKINFKNHVNIKSIIDPFSIIEFKLKNKNYFRISN